MPYCSYRPRAPLDRFVDFFWVIRGGETERRERILPSGTSELVFNLHEDEIRIYNSTETEGYRRLSGAVVSGAHSGVFICDAAQHRSIFGVHFLPAGASPFLGAPATELAELHTNLEDLWGSSAARNLRARLCEGTSTSQLFQVVEEALMERVCRTPARNPAIELALLRFGPAGTASSSRDVARELCMSQRRFIQRFAERVGLTPKVLCRVLRFQHARTVAEAAAKQSSVCDKHSVRPKIDWAETAAACGYYDQSHLIHEFQNLSGLSPSEYISQLLPAHNLKDNHLPLRK